MVRVPNHPPLLDKAAADIGGKTPAFQFTGTREEAQAILDELDQHAAMPRNRSRRDIIEGDEPKGAAMKKVQSPNNQTRPDGLPTGEGTAFKDDVADPHPDTEEDYDKIPHPGGTHTPKKPDIGPNTYAHDGTPPPRPHNKGSGPE